MLTIEIEETPDSEISVEELIKVDEEVIWEASRLKNVSTHLNVTL